ELPRLHSNPPLVDTAPAYAAARRPHTMDLSAAAGATGRRYRRQDEIGTPFCVTVDFDTIGERGPDLAETVTLRHRDSMEQERIAISELRARLEAAIF
ncbi:MAG: His/Gly/Thr/Pro-type tRNA ligase C-terminal domain-containing protein, partial [Chthoniobacterales bacterium]